ncbi:hypothetical protein BgAZ_403380 [Babesia gibsoni]|uniref:RecQ mediated genome instability protein 1 OB-fold domain-containing protein n=1 Tax=Babesia gibsoni TaxID=33632 RepID=A0AAD8PCQ6_BABGI|nr:hypothetical protein BgAZ_403380 [Babesia gibsoni]
MEVSEDVLRDIQRKWNLAIPAGSVKSLLSASDSYKKEVGDEETFEKSLLGTDLYLIRSLVDKEEVTTATKNKISASTELDGMPHPVFCQVVNVIDVTQPKNGDTITEHSGDPLYKVTLTTGKTNFYALLLNSGAAIHEVAPGSKLLITNPKVLHMDSMAILYPKDYKRIGGKVMSLFRSWMIEREVKSQRHDHASRRLSSDIPRFEPIPTSSSTIEEKMGSLSIKGPPKDRKPKVGDDRGAAKDQTKQGSGRQPQAVGSHGGATKQGAKPTTGTSQQGKKDPVRPQDMNKPAHAQKQGTTSSASVKARDARADKKRPADAKAKPTPKKAPEDTAKQSVPVPSGKARAGPNQGKPRGGSAVQHSGERTRKANIVI